MSYFLAFMASKCFRYAPPVSMSIAWLMITTLFLGSIVAPLRRKYLRAACSEFHMAVYLLVMLFPGAGPTTPRMSDDLCVDGRRGYVAQAARTLVVSHNLQCRADYAARRNVGLQTPAPSAAALAASTPDDNVPKLSRGAVVPIHHAPVGYDARTHARTQGDLNEIIHPPCAAIHHLADGRSVRVIVDNHRYSRIAPPDKKALYMGYSFIPVFIGNILAGIISGFVYQRMSDKVTITEHFAAEKGLQMPEGLSTNAYFEEVAHQVSLTPGELTDLLWETYNPSGLWMVLFAIGLFAAVALFIYDRAINK